MIRLKIGLLGLLLISLGVQLQFAIAGDELPEITINYTPGQLKKSCSESIVVLETKIQGLVVASSALQNQSEAFDRLLWDFFNEAIPMVFVSSVGLEEKVRAESDACFREIIEYFLKLFSRREIYKVLGSKRPKDYAAQRIWSMARVGFQENGLTRTQEKADEIQRLGLRLHELEQRFELRLKQDQTVVAFTPEELAGVPDAVLKRLTLKRGRYQVSLRPADIQDVLTHATSEQTRKKLYLQNESKPGPENIDDLEEALEIRQRLAKILGYPSWLHYQMRTEVASSPKQVFQYLETLHERLAPALAQNLNQLDRMKARLTGSRASTKPWDFLFLENQVLKNEIGPALSDFQSYFPAEQTIERMLRLFGWLFGVQIEEVTDFDRWVPELKLYRFKDQKTGNILGHAYLDLYQRPGKYNHAAAFQLKFGFQSPTKSQLPAVAVVSNFTPSVPGSLSHLSFGEIETAAHEFGHLFHFLLSGKHQSPAFSGVAVPTDFVESPSQFFEYFVRVPEVLELLSGRLGQPGQKLPLETAQRVIQHVQAFQPLHMARVVFRSMLDMTLHTVEGKVDSTEIAQRLYHTYMGVPLPRGAFPQASFGHLMGGYDGKYYAYPFSRAFSADFFKQFARVGILSEKAQELGLKFRKEILEPGYFHPPAVLCRNLLKRNPNAKEFLSEFAR